MVDRGLRTIAGGLLVTLVLVIVTGVLLLSLAGGPGLTLVLGLALAVPYFWIAIRIVFWPLAVFDGAGIVEAFRTSWMLSRGAVERMVGWALATIAVLMLVRIALGIVLIPLGDESVIRSGIEAAVSEAFAVFNLFVLAVLYESQRRLAAPDRGPRPTPMVPDWPQPTVAPPSPWAASPDGTQAVGTPPAAPGTEPPPPADPWHPWRG